jgi:hypothetical protein
VEADLTGDRSAAVLRVGMEDRRRKVMSGADEQAERIVDVALRMAMSGNIPTSVVQESEEPTIVDCNTDGFSLVFGSERRNVTRDDLRSVWRRFEEWTVRADKTADFAGFFQDLNRWGGDGHGVIRKTAALLLFARALVDEAERIRGEDL